MSLDIKYLNINGRDHPYFTLNGGHASLKTPIHFTGANGFPAAVYHSFLSQFTAHHPLSAADCRGAFSSRQAIPKRFGFEDFADDLIEIVEALYSKPVIAMGHSFGAHVSLIAAIKRPDLFEQLVLIEPASLPSAKLDLIYRRLPVFLLHRLVPMISQTLQRQRIWASRSAFIEKYHHHRTFKHFTEEAMQAYAEHGLKETHNGQFELIFDPTWEAHIFANVEFVWKNLKKSQTPCLFLRAEHSNLYSSPLFHQQNRALGHHFTGLELKNTHHLMPFEAPSSCAQAINSWLDRAD